MSATVATQPAASAAGKTDPRRWLALSVVLIAAFMDLLDAGIVFLALPQIQQDLQASYSALQWTVAGYTLTFALVLITAGRLGTSSAESAYSSSGWPASPPPRYSAPPPRAQPC
jgi:hypothetical protein